MLVGDIYGGRDYTGIGLSANTIASSFGKVINSDKVLLRCCRGTRAGVAGDKGGVGASFPGQRLCQAASVAPVRG